MTLQTTGAISISQINTEKGLTSTTANSSLTTLSTTSINTVSTSRPDQTAPHAMSEFYGYNHSAAASYAVTITGGSYSAAADTFTISWTGTALPSGGYYVLQYSDLYVNTSPLTKSPASSPQTLTISDHGMNLVSSGSLGQIYNELSYLVIMKSSGGTSLAQAGGVLGFYYFAAE